MTESEEQGQPPAPRAGLHSKYVTLAGLVVVMLCGILVAYNYHLRNVRERYEWRPPYIGELKQYLQAVNRTGEEVSLEELRGKVWVCGYLFTDCPAQCPGVAAEMKRLYEEFKDDGRFCLVSVSVNPAGDTPEKMDAFVKKHGVDVPEWWFLTGDEERLRRYMQKYFHFMRVQENTDADAIATQGLFAHDPRLALVDETGHIRGYYNLYDPRFRDEAWAKIRRDIGWLLGEAAGAEQAEQAEDGAEDEAEDGAEDESA